MCDLREPVRVESHGIGVDSDGIEALGRLEMPILTSGGPARRAQVNCLDRMFDTPLIPHANFSRVYDRRSAEVQGRLLSSRPMAIKTTCLTAAG